MPQKKQTARKTTGKHVKITSILSRSGGRSTKRVRYDPLANSVRVDSSPLRSKRSVGTSSSDRNHPSRVQSGTSATPHTSPPKPARDSSPPPPPVPSDLSDLLFMLCDPPLPPPSVPQTNGSTSGTMTRRHPQLHTPISVCIRFATWLETQTCAHEDALAQAVERDGEQLLSLARATIAFDNALRGNVLPPVNGVGGALGEHARTLRVFAQLLQTKISEGTLSEDLEKAVLRDGEALLRLALCCLDFEQAVQGSGAAS